MAESIAAPHAATSRRRSTKDGQRRHREPRVPLQMRAAGDVATITTPGAAVSQRRRHRAGRRAVRGCLAQAGRGAPAGKPVTASAPGPSPLMSRGPRSPSTSSTVATRQRDECSRAETPRAATTTVARASGVARPGPGRSASPAAPPGGPQWREDSLARRRGRHGVSGCEEVVQVPRLRSGRKPVRQAHGGSGRGAPGSMSFSR